MAATPRLKVYDSGGEFLAFFRYPHHAAVLTGYLGKGATIRAGSHTLYTEGVDDASENYEIILTRFKALMAQKEGGRI